MKQTDNYGFNKPELSDPANITQLDYNWDQIDIELERIDYNLEDHRADKNNPHNVTKEQLGIDLSEFEEHIQNKNNPHNVTKEQLGIDLSAYDEHLEDKNNPHKVTASQINAVSKNGDTVNGDLIVKGEFTVEDYPIKSTNGITTVEIQGLNNPTEDGHHFVDYSLSGTNGSVHLRVNLENENGMHSPRELIQLMTLDNSGEQHWYQILHEGHKTSGTYNGTGSPHTVSTQGLGNAIIILSDHGVSNYYASIITPFGGFTVGNVDSAQSVYTWEEVTFTNGTLNIKKDFIAGQVYRNNGINASGIVYHYYVI